MPETVETTVYRIDELNDKAREKARDWYRTTVLNTTPHWYDRVFSDFEEICRILGITLKRRTRAKRTRTNRGEDPPCIWFSGFWSQGDGASFEGRWEHAADSATEIRKYAPLDKELHAISDALTATQERNGGELEAEVSQRGIYYHEYTMDVEVSRDSDADAEPTTTAEEEVRDTMRKLARWLYDQLRDTYEAESGDAEVDETVNANKWRFTTDGEYFAT